MKNVLVVFAHPSPNKSGLNRHLFDTAAELQHVETRDLYELYPNLHIDVPAEHEALRRADVLVFHFPIYWFSSPSILKEWQDTVLTSKFAYGDGEKALEGKQFMVAVSTGGTGNSYTQLGRHGAGIETYLAPFEQTARFCGMKLTDPFIVQGAGDLTAEQVDDHTNDFARRLIELGKYSYGS